jgi:hypothetical protein
VPSPFRTFRAGRSDRDEARLRIAATFVTALSAGLYALARPGPLSIAVSLAVITAGVFWARRANAALARSERVVSLTLDETGVDQSDGDLTRKAAWSEIARIELDEDLLVVRLVREGQDDLVIEPIYEGASLYELAEAIGAARLAAKERPRSAPV